MVDKVVNLLCEGLLLADITLFFKTLRFNFFLFLQAISNGLGATFKVIILDKNSLYLLSVVPALVLGDYCGYIRQKDCYHIADINKVCGTDGNTYRNQYV